MVAMQNLPMHQNSTSRRARFMRGVLAFQERHRCLREDVGRHNALTSFRVR